MRWRTSKEPEMIAARTASCPCLNSKRFQGALRVRRAGRNTRSSKPVDQGSLFPSWLLECTRQVPPPPFGLAKLSPSCLQRERYFSRCGAKRERKGENVLSISPPRSRPLCRKTKFTTDAAGARRCDFKARPTSARDIPSKSGKRSSRSWLSARRPKVLGSYSVGTSPINTVTGPSQPRQKSIAMSITPSMPEAPQFADNGHGGPWSLFRANIPMSRMGFELEEKGRLRGCSSCVTVRAVRCQRTIQSTTSHRKGDNEPRKWIFHCKWRSDLPAARTGVRRKKESSQKRNQARSSGPAESHS